VHLGLQRISAKSIWIKILTIGKFHISSKISRSKSALENGK